MFAKKYIDHEKKIFSLNIKKKSNGSVDQNQFMYVLLKLLKSHYTTIIVVKCGLFCLLLESNSFLSSTKLFIIKEGGFQIIFDKIDFIFS